MCPTRGKLLSTLTAKIMRSVRPFSGVVTQYFCSVNGLCAMFLFLGSQLEKSAENESVDLTNVAVRLLSNRSQMTSKCGKNKKVAHEAQPSVSLIFLPHFDVLCNLLLNRRTATWNLFVLYTPFAVHLEKIRNHLH